MPNNRKNRKNRIQEVGEKHAIRISIFWENFEYNTVLKHENAYSNFAQNQQFRKNRNLYVGLKAKIRLSIFSFKFPSRRYGSKI